MNIPKRALQCYFSLLLLLISGCAKDNISDSESPHGDETIELNLTIASTGGASTGGADDTNALGAAEYAINHIRIYAFDGDILDVNYSKDVNSITGSIEVTMEIKKSAQKSLYVIINEPLSLSSRLPYITTIDQLADLDFALAAHFKSVGYAHDETFDANSFDIPMTGETGTFDTSGDSSIPKTIKVTRSVARVDVLLKTKDNSIKLTSESSLKVNNTRANSFLFKPTTLPSATGDFITTTIETATSSVGITSGDEAFRAFSFYVPERTYGDDQNHKLGFELNNIIYNAASTSFNEVKLNMGTDGSSTSLPTALTKIERNKVYKVVCVVSKKGFDISNILIVDWEEDFINGDIDFGTVIITISAPNKVLMSEDTYGEGFTKIVPYEGSRPVGLFVGGVEIPYGNGITDIRPASAPSWLTAAKWEQTDAKGKKGTLTFTYEKASSVETPPFLIELRNGSVIRKMSVEYGENPTPTTRLL